MCATRQRFHVNRLIGSLIVALLSAAATGCAPPAPAEAPVDPHAGRSMLELMHQLSTAPLSVAQLSASDVTPKRSSMVVLGELDGLGVEKRRVKERAYSADDLGRWCPSVKRSLAKAPDARSMPAPELHRRRLAKALLRLDAELVASGHGSAGCRAQRRVSQAP